jgi:hypothetical protein
MLTSLKKAVFGEGPKVRRIPAGLYRGLTMELDLARQTQLFLGLIERETHSWIRSYVAGARSAIDIGAGEGELVLYLLKRTAVEKVYAFEPSDQTRARLIQNLALNDFAEDQRVNVSAKFVGSTDVEQSCSLDSIAAHIEQPGFIKIDVDGNELDILAGASNLLDSGCARWLVETHSEELEQECLAVFHQSRYRTRVIPNGWYRAVIPETRPIPHNRWLVAEPA